MKRAALLGVAALAGCSDGPGALVLTVDQVPPLVAATDVLVAGGITRTPAKNTDLIVTITGGAAPAADTLRGIRYEVRVPLNANAANQLSITATDLAGSTSNSLNVTVRHDGQGPVITQATPADQSDNVGLINTVSLKFSEPVVIATGGGIVLSRQGGAIPGSTTRSADSLTLTYNTASGVTLSPNAIYRVGTSGLRDVAQNAVAAGTAVCFVTANAGPAPAASASDSVDDVFHGPPGVMPGTSGLLSPDLVAARFAREGSEFSGVFQFVGPRVFSVSVNNQASVLFDLDIDEDSTTGFKPVKDQLFEPSPTLGPTYSTGMGAEYVIGLEPHPQLGDSAYLGRYVSAEQFQPLGTFLPGMCGPFLGFVVPFATQFINDDGKMNVVVLSIAANNTEIFVDPIPTKRNLNVDLRAQPAPPFTAAAFLSAPPGPRTVRFPPRRLPLR